MSSPRQCPRCNGKSTVVKTYDDYGMADPKDVPCPTCDGSGLVVPAKATEILTEAGYKQELTDKAEQRRIEDA